MHDHNVGLAVTTSMFVLLTAYLAYCWSTGKTTTRIPWVLPWVYRAERPVLYWGEMVFYLFLDALCFGMAFGLLFGWL